MAFFSACGRLFLSFSFFLFAAFFLSLRVLLAPRGAFCFLKTHGHLDEMGRRRPIQVVVQTYLLTNFPVLSHPSLEAVSGAQVFLKQYLFLTHRLQRKPLDGTAPGLILARRGIDVTRLTPSADAHVLTFFFRLILGLAFLSCFPDGHVEIAPFGDMKSP